MLRHAAHFTVGQCRFNIQRRSGDEPADAIIRMSVAGHTAADAANIQGVGECDKNHAEQRQAVSVIVMLRQQVVCHQAQANSTEGGNDPLGMAPKTVPQPKA